MQTAIDATAASVERSGFGIRFGAYIIDLIIASIIAFVVGPILGGIVGAAAASSLSGSSDSAAMGGMFGALAGIMIAMPIVFFVYFLLEAFTGLTLGKLIVGIKVANADGTKADTSALLFRYVLKISGALLTVAAAFLGMGFLSKVGGLLNALIFFGCFMVLSSKKQTLHDLISKTAVFNKKDIK
jgi:uncharacterized RDD family membrane protein YckC